MNKILSNIINKLKLEGKDYTDMNLLLSVLKGSNIFISKDDILEFVSNNAQLKLYPTPNSVAELITKIATNYSPKNAIDICCGTGNILYYLQNITDNLTGIELIPNVATLASYICPNLEIITTDTFQYSFHNKYDLIVGNVPWLMKINTKNGLISSEEAFIRKGFELSSEKATLIFIVPYNVLESSLFQNFRNNYRMQLHKVIGLPAGSMKYTQVKVALLIFLSDSNNESVEVTQLHNVNQLSEEYFDTAKTLINKKRLIDRWNPEYLLSKEGDFYKELSKFETKPLIEMVDFIINGIQLKQEELSESGNFVFLMPKHFKNGILNQENPIKYVKNESLNKSIKKRIIEPGDILISLNINQFIIYSYQKVDPPAIASSHFFIIRSTNNDYIHSYLQTEDGLSNFQTQAKDLSKGTIIPNFSLKDLQEILIPIIPVFDLNKLGNKSIESATNKQLQSFKSELDDCILKLSTIHLENENGEKVLNFLKERINYIVTIMKSTVQFIDKLIIDFDQIKNLQIDEEEKIDKLNHIIDESIKSFYKFDTEIIENYIEEVKSWLLLWDKLDVNSQKFIPIAEYVFDQLKKIKDADYSPFIVEYCRSLENEILKKLFEAYHQIELSTIDRNELIKNDIDNKKTCTFAKRIKNNNLKYTLGEMQFIMNLMKENGDTLKNSKLLQHFKEFIISYFSEYILQDNFLDDIKKLTNDFRNQAAHPYSIGIEMANQCQGLLRTCLNSFLESIK